jgi:hypothetical protein
VKGNDKKSAILIIIYLLESVCKVKKDESVVINTNEEPKNEKYLCYARVMQFTNICSIHSMTNLSVKILEK